MLLLVACVIAGACTVGFVAIWFKSVYDELAEKRKCLEGLFEQLRLHEGLYAEAMDGPDSGLSAGMLETSRMLCREASKSYNHILRKPMNRVPALLMGFRAVNEYGEGISQAAGTKVGRQLRF